jgi:hypothetical protein
LETANPRASVQVGQKARTVKPPSGESGWT